MDVADPALGQGAGSGRRLRALGLGPRGQEQGSAQLRDARRSTASAPTSSSSTSRIPDTVDFISAGDTPYVWELNIWYHTLNAGFRTRISGETDFPVHLPTTASAWRARTRRSTAR